MYAFMRETSRIARYYNAPDFGNSTLDIRSTREIHVRRVNGRNHLATRLQTALRDAVKMVA